MATSLNRALVIKKETTYGTYPTVTTALEFIDGDTSFESTPTINQGEGIRAGALLADGSRSVVVMQDASGSIGVECLGKGQGQLWELLMGTGSSTVVSGATYQQLFTLNEAIPSFSAQEQWYTIDAAGAFSQDTTRTWVGCKFTDWELTFGDVVSLKANLNAQTKTTQTFVSVTLPTTSTNPFPKSGYTWATGTLTAATSTALASGATSLAGVENVVISCNHNLNTGRVGSAGLKGAPVRGGVGDVKVTMTVEHRDNTWHDALAAQTAVTLVATATGLTALSTGYETLQAVLADLRVQKVAKKIDAGVPKLDIELSAKNATTPMQIVVRTSDSAL